MRRKLFFAMICVIVFSSGLSGPAPTPGSTAPLSDIYMIDDFEDGTYDTNPIWWKFDNIKLQIVNNTAYQYGEPAVIKETGKYSLNIAGSARDWYAGGMGTYIAKKGVDLSKYNTFSFDVFGNGPGSGTINIELVDDDKGNWQVEQDSKGVPLYDDKFVYSQIVDWRGWKKIQVPLADFNLVNPGRGDGVLDLSQRNGGGGLLTLQLIFIAPKQVGSLKYNIDNVALIKK
jgi:hypothetical protein